MISGAVVIFIMEKKIDKLEFMFDRIKLFNKDEFYAKYNRNGYRIIKDAYNQAEAMKEEIVCVRCYSKDRSTIKGDGFRIGGTDYIDITCNSVK